MFAVMKCSEESAVTMPNYTHEHDLAKCNVYRCGMNHYPPTCAASYDDAINHLCGEWDCGDDACPQCDGPVLMVDAQPLRKWEPGSEPPDGWYFRYPLSLLVSLICVKDQCLTFITPDGKMTTILLSDWGGIFPKAIIGPIPEPEVAP